MKKSERTKTKKIIISKRPRRRSRRGNISQNLILFFFVKLYFYKITRAHTVKRNATVLVIVSTQCVVCCRRRSAASPDSVCTECEFYIYLFFSPFSPIYLETMNGRNTLVIIWGKMWSVNLSIAALAVFQTHTHTHTHAKRSTLNLKTRPKAEDEDPLKVKKIGFSTRVVRSIDDDRLISDFRSIFNSRFAVFGTVFVC